MLALIFQIGTLLWHIFDVYYFMYMIEFVNINKILRKSLNAVQVNDNIAHINIML